MKWVIDGQKNFDDAREAADYIMGWSSDSYFDNYLNGTGCDALTLKRDDSVEYDSAKYEWKCSEVDGITEQLEGMENGDIVTFYDFEVEFVEDASE